MIIFGWGHQRVKQYGSVRMIRCRNCFNERMWSLQKNTYYITLYFIPLIPYRTEYMLMCPICKVFDSLKKSEFEAYQKVNNDSQENLESHFEEQFNNKVLEAQNDNCIELVENDKLKKSNTKTVRKMEDIRLEQKQSKL